jgi:hypothetical protein
MVARPGTVNYTEGQVELNGQQIQGKSLGSVEVAPGQVLQTEANGKAEMLLYPGAFLRLGGNSALRMISPSISDTRVELLRGEALVEVDQIQKENHLNVMENAADVHIEKKGVYSFKTEPAVLAVYDGKAEVQENDRSTSVGKGKDVFLTPDGKLKAQSFDRDQTDSLYDWSRLRSGYLAEANMSSAQTIVVDNPGWWAGTGWYWNPWFDTWAFVPGGGFLYSPFGYGFYSPAFWYYNAPVYYPVRPGRVFLGARGGIVARGGGAITPAPVGGPAFRAPAPAFHAPAMGGGGIRFGGRR